MKKENFWLLNDEKYHEAIGEKKRSSRLWTMAEEEFLRKNYGSKGTRYVADKLGRTQDAIRLKASALKICSGTLAAWTEREISFLKSNYSTLPIPQIARELNRSEGGVITKIRDLDLLSTPSVSTSKEQKESSLTRTKTIIQIATNIVLIISALVAVTVLLIH